MNYSQKLSFGLLMMASVQCCSMIQITRDENGFRVFDGQQEYPVTSHFVDPLLKRVSPEQLETFVEQGNRIRAIRLSDGQHRLQAMVTGKGGGPISGLIAYWVTKSLCSGLT